MTTAGVIRHDHGPPTATRRAVGDFREMEFAIDRIQVGSRFRRDLGDVGALAESINRLGLLHPLVLNKDGELVAGQRRLEAVKLLGWGRVPVTVVETLDDAVKCIEAEREENEERKDFTPSEAVAIAQALRPLEQEAAKERQGTRTDLQPSGNLPGSSRGDSRDKVAAAVGMSGRTLDKATAVVEAAQAAPEVFEPIRQEMDRTGKVDPSFRQVEEIVKRAAPELYALADGDGVIRGENLEKLKSAVTARANGEEPLTLTSPPRQRAAIRVKRHSQADDDAEDVAICIKELAETTVTGEAFKAYCRPTYEGTLTETRKFIPKVRALLDAIEREP